MTTDTNAKLEDQAVNLRRAFDRSFAEAPRRPDALTEDLLAIQLGPDPYALRLSEIIGLFVGRRVTSVPSAVRELLGIAGFRGALLPVYDLRILLGYSPSSAARWLVVTANKPVALAFDAFDGHRRIDRSAISVEVQARQPHVQEVARTPEARPVLRLASVLEAIEQRSRVSQTNKGR